MAIINTLYNTNPYQDKIMGGLEGDPLTNISNKFARSGTGIDQGFINQYNLEQRNDPMFNNEEYEEIPGFNFKDAPIETSFFKRMADPAFKPYMNNPNKGIIDNLILSKGNPDASLVNKTKNIGKKGFSLGKQGLLTALGFATGIPLGILGMLPKMDPRQKALREFYGYDNIGRVPQGQLMAGYSPVSGGLLNMITGGKMGEETTYGLGGAIDKRIARIQKTLKKKKSAVLEQRVKDLQALKDRENKALKDARALAQANKEIKSKGYQDYGQGAASRATQRSYEAPDGSYAGASTQDYGGGE